MQDFVRIGPDAVFASMVLRPSWGRQDQREPDLSRRNRSAQVIAGAGENGGPREDGERTNVQMSLL